MQSRWPAVEQLAQLLEPRHPRDVALDWRAARAAIASPTSRAAPPTHDCAVVEFQHTRALLALRAGKKAPVAAVRKLAVRDPNFSPQRVVTFAERNDDRFRVPIHDAQGPEPRDAR
jgi:hypothetical protein